MVRASLEYFKKEDIGYVPRVGEFMFGATGYCCGGTCTWYFGSRLEDFKALVPYYGLYKLAEIDFSKIKVHQSLRCMRAWTPFIPLSEVMEAIQRCNENKVNAQFLIYAGCGSRLLSTTQDRRSITRSMPRMCG
jgi:carboxymethylenebutenolidase